MSMARVECSLNGMNGHMFVTKANFQIGRYLLCLTRRGIGSERSTFKRDAATFNSYMYREHSLADTLGPHPAIGLAKRRPGPFAVVRRLQ